MGAQEQSSAVSPIILLYWLTAFHGPAAAAAVDLTEGIGISVHLSVCQTMKLFLRRIIIGEASILSTVRGLAKMCN